MENQDRLDEYFDDRLTLNETSIQYIRETAKWARFLAILSFIMIGIMILVALFIGTIMAAFMSPNDVMPALEGFFMTLVYLFFALLYFIPTFYLYRYSTNTLAAIKHNDEGRLTEAMGNLKSVFKFMGILTIVILGFYVLMMLFLIVVGGLGGLLT